MCECVQLLSVFVGLYIDLHTCPFTQVCVCLCMYVNAQTYVCACESECVCLYVCGQNIML